MSIESIRKIKADALIPKPKKIYRLNKVSKKNQKRIAEDGRPDDERLDEWFLERRKEMTGTCSCGCAGKSSKNDDMFYRHSICHIFPKSKFKSVMTHPLNWVELSFWGGHHTVFDEGGMDKWPGMACFDDIKEKFKIMEPYLTDAEKGFKFYSKLKSLIDEG